jgi:ATP synthase protein I
MSATAFCTGAQLLPLRRLSSEALHRDSNSTVLAHRRATPRCGSLEESKKRARSAYDNIPDLNQLYLRELARVSGSRGYITPGKESTPGSILRPSGVLSPTTSAARRRRRRVAAPLVPEYVPTEDEKAQAFEASLEAYQALRAKILGDTLFVGALAVCGGWALGDVNTAISVGLGCAGSCAYVFLLSRGVDRLGSTGDALAPARLAVLALLVLFSAKHREVLQVLPVMLGFFTYKVATLLPLVTGEAFEDSP